MASDRSKKKGNIKKLDIEDLKEISGGFRVGPGVPTGDKCLKTSNPADVESTCKAAGFPTPAPKAN